MDHPQLAAAARAFVDRFNAGDPQAVRRHIATDFWTYTPEADEPTATDVWASLTDDLRGGLPDLRVTLDALEPADDGAHLAGQVTVTGTHTQPLWGVPPTGAAIEWTTPISVRSAAGGFAVNFDGFAAPGLIGLLRQLELVNPADQMDRPPKHPTGVAPDFLLRLAFNGGVAYRPCSHLEEIGAWESDATVCPRCVASGDIWPALRLCMTCGFVGCCDTSTNTHMKRHWEETGHPLMRSIRPGEGWMWCYADNALFDRRILERQRARLSGGR